MPTLVNPESDLLADDSIQQTEQAPSDEALEQLLPAAEQGVGGKDEDAMNLQELAAENADGNSVVHHPGVAEGANVPFHLDGDATAPSRALTEPERRKRMSDDVLVAFFCDMLEKASSQPFCIKKTGSGELKRKCTCLHLLRDPVLRLPVAKYLVSLECNSKQVKDQLLLDWCI